MSKQIAEESWALCSGARRKRYFNVIKLPRFPEPCNGWHRRKEIEGSKVMMFHAKDDPNVPYARTKKFAEITGTRLKTLQRGRHISTDYVVRRHWVQIKKFFESK